MFDFIEMARIPDFVKSLADIQEYSRAVSLVIECLMYGVGNPVALLDDGVGFPEPELMMKYPGLLICIVGYVSHKQLFKYLGDSW